MFFDGKDIRIKVNLARPDDRKIIVTFTGRTSAPPSAMGFGEAFLAKRNISAIHFISKDNHWWQTGEVKTGIEALRKNGIIRPDCDLTLYGSSMGGYAALMYSGELRPRRVVAISPQYSIDGKVVPFERRWRNYASKLKFNYDNMDEGLDPKTNIYLIYDSYFIPDAQHVALVERHRPITRVSLPFAGHNTARYLEETSVISSLIAKLFTDNYVHRSPALSGTAAFISATLLLSGARMRDAGLITDILNFAIDRAVDDGHADLAGKFLQALRAHEPNSPRTAVAISKVALLSGDFDLSIESVRTALRKKSNEPEFIAQLVEVLLAKGEVAAALQAVEMPADRVPKAAALQLALARTLLKLGRADDALPKAARASRLAPHSLHAVFALAQALRGIGRIAKAQRTLSVAAHSSIASPALAAELKAILESLGSRKVAVQAHTQFVKAMAARTRAVAALGLLKGSDPKTYVAFRAAATITDASDDAEDAALVVNSERDPHRPNWARGANSSRP
jgi:tetratricopeptide (TPR) repeat protein